MRTESGIRSKKERIVAHREKMQGKRKSVSMGGNKMEFKPKKENKDG